MTVKSLKVFIGVDLSEFESGMNKIEASLNRHQKQFTAIGGAMTVIGGIVTGFFTKSVSEAVKSEAAHEKLESAMRNVAGAQKGAADMLAEYAGVLQRTTGIEDEEIVNAQAMLATMGLNERQIAALTPRILDMATARAKATGEEINLKEAAMALGKAVTGHVELLGRHGIVLSDNTKKTGDFALILKDLDRAFGGAAAAAGTTFAGQMRILKANIGETFEAIGSRLIPILLPLVTKIGDVVKHVLGWMDSHKELMKTLVPILAGLGALNLVLGPLVGFFPTLFAGIHAVAGAFVFLSTNPIVLVIAGLVALGIAIKDVVDRMKEASGAEGIFNTANRALYDQMLKSYEVAHMSVEEFDALAKKHDGNAIAMRNAILREEEGKLVKMAFIEQLVKQGKSLEEIETLIVNVTAKQVASNKAIDDGTGGLKKFSETIKAIQETPLIGNWGKARQDLIDVFNAWNDSAAITFSFIGETSKNTAIKLVNDFKWMKDWLKKNAEDVRINFAQKFQKIIEVASMVVSSISGLFSAMGNKSSIELENMRKKSDEIIKTIEAGYDRAEKDFKKKSEAKQKTMDADYEAEKKRIEDSELSEQEKNDLLYALQAKHAADSEKLKEETDTRIEEMEDAKQKAVQKMQDETDRKTREVQREGAKRTRAANLMEAITGTAAAVVNALKTLNIPFAIAIGALGAIQIGIIAGTPLPALAKGGYFDRPTLAVVGDVPEFVIPAARMRPAFAGGYETGPGKGGTTVIKNYLQISIGGQEIKDFVVKTVQQAAKRGLFVFPSKVIG